MVRGWGGCNERAFDVSRASVSEYSYYIHTDRDIHTRPDPSDGSKIVQVTK